MGGGGRGGETCPGIFVLLCYDGEYVADAAKRAHVCEVGLRKEAWAPFVVIRIADAFWLVAWPHPGAL